MLEILLNGVLTGAIAFVVFIGIFNIAAWRVRKNYDKKDQK